MDNVDAKAVEILEVEVVKDLVCTFSQAKMPGTLQCHPIESRVKIIIVRAVWAGSAV